MPILDLNDVVGSYQLDQTNYDTVGTRFLDASKFNNHLDLVTGTPLWTTIDSREGLSLDNQFYFEFDNYPCIPKGSAIYAVNLNAQGTDGSLFYMQWFYGKEASGDHAVSSYDPAIDPFSTSIRDQSHHCFGNSIRTFDGQGTNVSTAAVADKWVIITSVIELFPAKIRQAADGGVFTESTVASPYLLNTFGNIFRLGQLNATGTPPTSSSIRLGELHLFQGDVSQQADYASFVGELKTKYGIT